MKRSRSSDNSRPGCTDSSAPRSNGSSPTTGENTIGTYIEPQGVEFDTLPPYCKGQNGLVERTFLLPGGSSVLSRCLEGDNEPALIHNIDWHIDIGESSLQGSNHLHPTFHPAAWLVGYHLYEMLADHNANRNTSSLSSQLSWIQNTVWSEVLVDLIEKLLKV
jgi:hypothetical protein